MKKKILSWVLSFALVVTMSAAVLATQAVGVNATEMGNTNVSLSLDYDKLTKFNTNHTGSEIATEIKQKMEVDSQYYHVLKGVSFSYFESGTSAYKPVGNSLVDKNSVYYLVVTVGFKNYTSDTKSLKFNGRTLKKCSSNKPEVGEFMQGQIKTIDNMTCVLFHIPVDVKPKWVSPDPKIEKTSVAYTGKPVSNKIINMNSNMQFLADGSVKSAQEVGTYAMTVKLMDKSVYCYSNGTTADKTFKWKIVPAKPTIKSITVGKNKMLVQAAKKPEALGATNYQIQYMQKGTKNAVNTTTDIYYKTIKKLKSGKYYYVRVRAYKKVSGTYYYGEWTKTVLSKIIK